MAIQTHDPVTSDQLAYGRLLVSEARRHGGLGWVDYDRAFWQQLAENPTLPWNSGLQVSTLLGQRAGQGMFCTLCRGVDHILFATTRKFSLSRTPGTVHAHRITH